MTAKEFLTTDKRVNQKSIAEIMYPNKSGASVQLNMKLKNNRPWTDNDERLATEALKQLGHDLINAVK